MRDIHQKKNPMTCLSPSLSAVGAQGAFGEVQLLDGFDRQHPGQQHLKTAAMEKGRKS